MNSVLNLLCPPAAAHPGSGSADLPVSADVWWSWSPEWVLLFILLFVGAAYGRLLRQSLGSDFSLKYPLLFAGGLFVIYAGAASAIDRVGEEYLFSVHMVQHNLFMYLAPWLLLAGIPTAMAEDCLKRSGRWGDFLYRVLSQPVFACLSFNLVFTLWHIPYLYDWALQDQMVHNVEHASIIITALMMWLPLWSPLRSRRPKYPLQLLYLVAVAIAQLPVFAYVTFSKTVLYPTYELAPRLTALSPLADQQAGGVLMKLVGMLVLFIAFASVFMAWYKEQQAEEDAQAQELKAVPLQSSPAALQS